MDIDSLKTGILKRDFNSHHTHTVLKCGALKSLYTGYTKRSIHLSEYVFALIDAVSNDLRLIMY